MLLADLGAEVIRFDRPESLGQDVSQSPQRVLFRGRKSVLVDLKSPQGRDVALRILDKADALIEGFRPGVMERLGLGPEVLAERNPRLIYGRMTGWGQDGPLSQAAGHDINYVALSGALHYIGEAGRKPVPPLNLVGDFGGGGLLLAFGILAAVHERSISGKGQVVDAAMVDGAAALMAMFHGARDSLGRHLADRGEGLLNGGAHYYNTYETADGRYISIGSMERKFYVQLIDLLGVDGCDSQDPADWPENSERFAAAFKTRTRDEWCKLLEGTDVCFAPVLSLDEVYEHPHHVARGSYIEIDGVPQPVPAPRFGRSPATVPVPQPQPGAHTRDVLAAAGITDAELERLVAEGAIAGR